MGPFDLLNHHRRIAESSHFNMRIDSRAFVKGGTEKSPVVQFRIYFSQINEFKPFGIFIGTEQDALSLTRFVGHKIWPLTLQNVPSGSEPHIKAKIHLRFCSHPRRYNEEDGNKDIYEIGFFEVLEVSIQETVNLKDNYPRHITFFLEGPSDLWLSPVFRIVKYDGSVTASSRHKRLNLGANTKLKCDVSSHFFYKHRAIQEPRQLNVEADVFSITFWDSKFSGDQESFIEYTSKIADKLCLYVSFLSKFHIQWFGYSYVDAATVVNTNKSIEYKNSTPLALRKSPYHHNR